MLIVWTATRAGPLVVPNLIHLPLIECVITADCERVKNFDSSDWVLFTSAKGVSFFKEHHHKELLLPRVAVFGKQTKEALGKYFSITPDLFYSGSSSSLFANTVAAEISDLSKLYLVKPKESPFTITKKLRAKGFTVIELPLYRTVPRIVSDIEVERLARAIKDLKSAIFVIFSPSAGKALAKLLGRAPLTEIAPMIQLAAFGPGTAEYLKRMALPPLTIIGDGVSVTYLIQKILAS
jgi:uroporphyrinogen-III synthase